MQNTLTRDNFDLKTDILFSFRLYLFMTKLLDVLSSLQWQSFQFERHLKTNIIQFLQNLALLKQNKEVEAQSQIAR